MVKRCLVVVALLLAVTMPLASTVSAEQISGTGTLWARGAGLAVLKGSGRVQIKGHGVGLIWIKNAEHIEASGQGRKWEIPETGANVFLGWSGTVLASGHHLTIWMVGGLIEFTASGTGKAFIQGRGIYRVNHREGEWRSTGSVLSLDPTSSAQSPSARSPLP